MVKKSNDEIVPITQQNLSLLPDFLKEKIEVRGMENIQTNDVKIPTLQLAQAISSAAIRGAKNERVGHIVDSITGEDLGEEIEVIPLKFVTQRIYFKPQSEGQGIVCSSRDGLNPKSLDNLRARIIAEISDIDMKVLQEIKACEQCPFSQWGKHGAPKCTVQKVFLVYVPKKSAPYQIYLSKTKMSVATTWISLIKYAQPQADIFARKYKISVYTDKNKAGTEFYNMTVSKVGFASEDEYRASEALYESFKQVALDNNND